MKGKVNYLQAINENRAIGYISKVEKAGNSHHPTYYLFNKSGWALSLISTP